MTDTVAILELADAGHTPGAIAAALNLTTGRVYATLRAHRPDRVRSPRTRTSEKPGQVLFLAAQGVRPGRIAVLLGISRAYVYRVLAESC